MTNEKNCILAERCKLAGGASCSRQCSAFISLHGMSGKGGRVAAAGLPADYRLLTLKNSPARAGQPQIYQALEGYVDTFERQFDEDGDRIKSFYLFSESPGTGKTTTASALIGEYIVRNYLGHLRRNRQTPQIPAYFLSINALQQIHNKTHLPATIQTKEKLGEELLRKIELAKRTPFVVLDDLAVRKATSSFAGILYDICDYRTTEKLPTIFTSNKSPDELKEFFRDEDPEGKIVDRIIDMAAVLHFSGESRRGKR